MAAHPDVVEAVIAASTDESPPSRRMVIEAIREHRNHVVKKDPGAISRHLDRLLADYGSSMLLAEVLRFLEAMPDIEGPS